MADTDRSIERMAEMICRSVDRETVGLLLDGWEQTIDLTDRLAGAIGHMAAAVDAGQDLAETDLVERARALTLKWRQAEGAVRLMLRTGREMPMLREAD